MEQIRRIMRPTDVPDQGLLCDLLWSDPDKDTMGWGENDRGVSFTFGAEVRHQAILGNIEYCNTIPFAIPGCGQISTKTRIRPHLSCPSSC